MMKRQAWRLMAAITSLCVFASGATQAGDLGEFFGYSTSYQVQALYSIGMRMEDAADGNINAPPDPKIPIATFLKLPGSINSDDGDRNFKKFSIINNRASLLGELNIHNDDRGLILRGDYFYDYAYRSSNDNDSPNTINKTRGPVNEFTDAASFYDGNRARLLDAYIYENFDIGDDIRGSVRLGQHVVAWGESLFFGGIALAQGPADGTKANLPGADVKSILLPVNQISLKMSVGDNWTVYGLYKLAHKTTEVNPVGEYFSITDAIGPGAEFAYGIRNPLYPDNLARANLTSKDLGESLQTIGLLLGVPNNQQLNINVPGGLPPLNLPVTGLVLQNASPYINVRYTGIEKPSKYGQYGLGLKYHLLDNTDVALYYLRYHDTLPAPVFTYGYAELAPAANGLPAITTQAINLLVPVTYKVRYFDGIHLTGATFSTTMFGANVAGEFIYRDGAIILANAQTAFGPIPTPTRAKTLQADLNALYIINPAFFWDDITNVFDIGYQHVQDFDPVTGPDGKQSTELTYTRDSAAFSLLSMVNIRNIFDGWDLQSPIAVSGMISGHSSLLAGFGGLVGEGDYRGSVGFNFTRAQALTLGVSYNMFFGSADYTERPFADRDYAAFNAKYTF